MAYFVVMARQRWGTKCQPLTQVKGSEQRAVDIAQKIHRDGAMNRTMVVDEAIKVVFKIDRRCKCTNCQYDFNGQLKCEDCGLVQNTNGFKVEEYQ